MIFRAHRARSLSLLAVSTLVFALLPGVGPTADAQTPEPTASLGAVVSHQGLGNGAVGAGWVDDVSLPDDPAGVTVELFGPDDPTGAGVPLDTRVGDPDPEADHWFGVHSAVTFGPGFLIRATGIRSGHQVETVVADVQVTEADRIDGTVRVTTTHPGPVRVDANTSDVTGHYPETVTRMASYDATTGGWIADFSAPPGPDESGAALALPVEVLSGQAIVADGTGGDTLAGYSTPRLGVRGGGSWWLQVESITEQATIEFSHYSEGPYSTPLLTPTVDERGYGGLHVDFAEIGDPEIGRLLDVWGTGEGWTITALASDGTTVLAAVTLPLLTIDAVNTTTAEISGRADAGLFMEVDTGNFETVDGIQFPVGGSGLWSVNLPVANRNVTAIWNSTPTGHDLFLDHPWPAFTYELHTEVAEDMTTHSLNSFGGAPLGPRSMWPADATVHITIDDPADVYDQEFDLQTYAHHEDGVTGFEVDLTNDLGDPSVPGSIPIPPDAVGHDWRFTAATELDGVPMSKTLTVQQVSIDDVDPALGTASGTCNPGGVEWIVSVEYGVHPDGWGESYFPECAADPQGDPDVGQWSIDFDPDAPLHAVTASYQEADVDVNAAAWWYDTGEPACDLVQALIVDNDPTTPSPSPPFGGSANGPYGVAVDDGGEMYVADPTANRVYRFDGDGNQTLSVGVSGDADGVGVDVDGNIYVGSGIGSPSSFVRKIAPDGTTVQTMTGYYFADPADRFLNPRGIAIDDAAGWVYFGESGGGRARVYRANTDLTEATILIGKTDPEPDFAAVGGVALDGEGNIYVAGKYLVAPGDAEGIVYKFAPDGTQLWTITDPVFTDEIWGVAVDGAGNVYVADGGSGSSTTDPDDTAGIYGFDQGGNMFLSLTNDNGVADPSFITLRDLAVDHAGRHLYATDYWTRTLYRFDMPCGPGGGDGGGDTEFNVHVNIDSVEGFNWPDGAMIHLEIDDLATAQTPDLAMDAQVGENDVGSAGNVGFRFGEEFDVQPGHEVTMTDGTTTEFHVVQSIEVTEIDTELDRVHGTADAGDEIWVAARSEADDASRTVTADDFGAWEADFSVPGSGEGQGEELAIDLVAGSEGGATETDTTNGNATEFIWRLADPRFNVEPLSSTISGWDWVEGTEVTITVDDPGTAESPDLEGSAPVEVHGPWEPPAFHLGFDPGEFRIGPGHLVTVTDGSTTKTHVVTALEVTGVDAAADTVSGRAGPGSVITVFVHGDEEGGERLVTAEPDGTWVADFTTGGPDHDPLDLVAGAMIEAIEEDEDHDATTAFWQLLEPRLTVDQFDDLVRLEWPSEGVTFDVSASPLGDGSVWTTTATTGQIGEFGWENGIVFDLHLEDRDVVTGTIVEVSDPATGEVVRSLVVTELTVTAVDPNDDGTVRGTGPPGSTVGVQLQNSTGWAWRVVETEPDGSWVADLGNEPPEGQEGEGVVEDVGHRFEVGFGAEQRDADGDATVVRFEEYRMGGVSALPDSDIVFGDRWTGLWPATLTIEDEFGTVVHHQTDIALDRGPSAAEIDGEPIIFDAPEWQNHFAVQLPIDLLPGYRVTISDGLYTGSTVVSAVTVTEVDLAADVVRGTATPGDLVLVFAGLVPGDPFITSYRFVCTETDGAWVADFGEPLTGPLLLECLPPDAFQPLEAGGDLPAFDLDHTTTVRGLASTTDSQDPFGDVPDDDDATVVTWWTHLTGLETTPALEVSGDTDVTFSATVAGTDPSDARRHVVGATVEWGDGESTILDEDALAPDAGGDIAVEIVHTYTGPDAQAILLTVEFADGHVETESADLGHVVAGSQVYRGDATIASGDVIEGNVTVIDGTLTVLGDVDGNITGRGEGDITLGPGAVVSGNVAERGDGGVEIGPRAVVSGNVTERGEGDVEVTDSTIRGNITERSAGSVVLRSTDAGYTMVEGNICERGAGTIDVDPGSVVTGNLAC